MMKIINKLFFSIFMLNQNIYGNNLKIVHSKNYNYIFNKDNGVFGRCGNDINIDPQLSPFGPELFDIEISTICRRKCRWCYKNNTDIGKNMSFKTFKTILDKIPNNLTQIAFGVGSIDANPDLEDILKYCRIKDIIPNITINGERMNDKYINILSKYCGVVAISNYNNEICYNIVKKFIDQIGINNNKIVQVNIHQLLSEETYDQCINILHDRIKDERLKQLTTIIYLLLKPVGNRNDLHCIYDINKFKKLVDYAMKNNIQFGFDSCSSPKFYEIFKNNLKYNIYLKMLERCESSLFSLYCNVDGYIYPCSFLENKVNGINILKVNDFLKDVWFSKELKSFRKLLFENNRSCPIYKL